MTFPLFILGLFFTALGAYLCWYYPNMRKTLTEPIDGTVVSYVEGTTSIARSRAGGKSAFKTVKAWYPVVTYTVNGVTHNYTCSIAELSEPEGIEGKTIPLLYNPTDPGKCLEAQPIKVNNMMAAPIIILLVGIGLIVLSFIL